MVFFVCIFCCVCTVVNFGIIEVISHLLLVCVFIVTVQAQVSVLMVVTVFFIEPIWCVLLL